jgi:transcriptional regulator with GAF, ATPase, and Fis domain
MLMSRTLLFSEGHAIRSFPDLGLGETAPLCLPWPEAGSLDAMLKVTTRSAEAQLLRRALAGAAGNLPLAAEGLGLTLRILALRLREHGIPLEDGESTLPRKAP